MSQERWDVALKVLNGPLAAMGEQVYRGPVVRIGAEPGPGGFRLGGYRGLDKRHAVITAYDGGTATIAPVGTNQVRMAPHPHVEWKEIDPMGGPEYLSEGCAVHLGPVGRGATLEFVECRRLGVWSGGNLQSAVEVAAAGGSPVAGVGDGVGMSGPAGAPPASFDARAVRRVNSSTVPAWFIGGLLMMSFLTVSLFVVAAIVYATYYQAEPLGPVEDGDERYEFLDIESVEVNPKLQGGLDPALYDFVFGPNEKVSGIRALDDPANWDPKFKSYIEASVQQHLSAWSFFKRLESIKDDYALVVEALRESELPEVFAAIPYRESLYDGSQQSSACAKGYWQFMPEVAYRVDQKASFAFKVSECTFSDAPGVTWSPSKLAPPGGVMKNAEYIDRSNPTCLSEKPEQRCCRIKSCKQDHRTDLKKSTQAAMFALGEAWEDETLRSSGAAVQITILSHNAGYDDSRFVGSVRPRNLLPAYKTWSKGKSDDETPSFYGENLTTSTPFTHDLNGSVLPPETQHYAYPIVAQHILAVCYYGTNYGDIKTFSSWKQYTRDDGYCKKLEIPSPEAVRKRGSKGKK